MSRIYIFFIMLFIASGVFAKGGRDLGLKVLEESRKDQITNWKLEDQTGRVFEVGASEELAVLSMQAILRQKDDFGGWKKMKIDRLSFFVSEQVIETNIVPAKLLCSDQNVAPYIPAGLFFTQGNGNTLEYNFRIQVDNNFIRIKGVYVQSQEVCSKILEAVADPKAYVRKRDPEFVLRKLDKLENKQNEFEAHELRLRARVKELEAEQAALKMKHNRLKFAALTLHNDGFFTGPEPLRQKLIERVLELKNQDAGLNLEAIVKKLEMEKFDASKDEVFLILSVYFNEFE